MLLMATCGGPGHFWPFIPLFWLLFFVLFFTFVVRRRRGPWCGPGWNGSGSAEAVLADRYAKGEISEEEFRQRLGVLREK